MAYFGIDGLIQAANLADERSAHRRKKITLVLGASGISVEGRYWDAELNPATERTLFVHWSNLDTSINQLVQAIEVVDAHLSAAWRAEAA